MKACFVGQRECVRRHALLEPSDGVEPSFIAHRPGADPARLRGALDELEPDVVVVLEPADLAPRSLAGVDALTLGFAAGPALRDGRSGEPAQIDVSQFDRLVASVPSGRGSLGITAWRSLPLPVADHLFADAPRAPPSPPRIAFVGESTEHRERWLVDVKHEYDVLHVVSGLLISAGLAGSTTRDLWGTLDVGINLHADASPAFENLACVHLAAGHLLVSEPLDPSHGLRPGLDYVEVRSPAALRQVIGAIRADPDAFTPIPAAGRTQAEAFRASRVFPRLLQEVVEDVRAFGSRRRR